jgi:hypothetical protein
MAKAGKKSSCQVCSAELAELRAFFKVSLVWVCLPSGGPYPWRRP